MRSGRRLSVDVGTVRIGVAASDFHAILASGVATIVRKESLDETLNELFTVINDVEPIEIYVGLPVKMSGEHSASTNDAIRFAHALAAAQTIPVRFIDERLTTVTAAGALRSSGRDSKSGRKIIDQIAATIILEQALEIERITKREPGLSVEEIRE